MARVQPPQADLQWEELEEGEGEGEEVGGGERGEGGGKGEQSKGVKGEEVERGRDTGDGSQGIYIGVHNWNLPNLDTLETEESVLLTQKGIGDRCVLISGCPYCTYIVLTVLHRQI